MILENKRKLKKEDNIFIYGAATTGAIVYHQLIKKGFKVSGFIDMRADEIDNYYSLPVINMKQLDSDINEKENSVIIIAIKNVFEHEKIARELWNIGYKKLLFRPYKELNSENQTQGLSYSYDRLINGIFPVEIYDIEKFEKKEFVDRAIIYEKDDYVVANIPVFYVYTDNYANKNIIWGDIPCVGLLPHIGLFRFFNGKDNRFYKEYMKFCREAAERSGGILTSAEWEKSVYNNRLDVFNHMEYMWEFEPDFFVKNAVWAQFNENGYFNIKSGKHRIVYMIVKGKFYIPLKIKKMEYKKWVDNQPAAKILDKLDNFEKLPSTLGNPYLYDFPCKSSKFYQKVLSEILFSIFEKEYFKYKRFDLKNKKVVFHNTPLSLYADIFYSLGFRVFIVESNSSYQKLLYEMFGDKVTFGWDKVEMENDIYLYINQDDSKMGNYDSDINIEITTRICEEKEKIVSGISSNVFLYAYKSEKE